MKKLILIFGIATTLFACQTVQEIKNDPVQFQIETIAAGMNKSLPVFVDEYTRLDSINIGKGRVVNYHYTLIGFNIDSINASLDSGEFDFGAIMENMLLETIKTNEDLSFYRENDATLNYSYVNETGKEVLNLTFPPEKYKAVE